MIVLRMVVLADISAANGSNVYSMHAKLAVAQHIYGSVSTYIFLNACIRRRNKQGENQLGVRFAYCAFSDAQEVCLGLM